MKGAHERRYVRRPVQATFRVREAADPSQGDLLFDAVDLSMGGAFLRSDLLLEIGDEVQVSFELPDGRSIRAQARVVWATGRSERKGSPGMGIQFLDLGDADRAAVADYVRSLR